MDHSDSLPPSPSIRSGITPPDREGRTGKIETISPELKALQRPARIEGEVIRHNRDGSVRIHTEKGDIDIKLTGRDLPVKGERIELQLPAGDPPARATIRALPPQAETPPPAASRPAEIPAEPRPPSPRLTQEISQNLTERAAAPREIRQLPLKSGDLVRLMPLLPETVEQLINQSLPVRLETTMLPPIAESFPLVAKTPQNAPSQPPITAPVKLSAPVLLESAPAFTAANKPVLPEISLIAPSSGKAATTILPTITTLLPQPLTAASDSQPLSFKPPTGKAPIDVLIQTIDPPLTKLVLPESGGRFEALVAALDSNKTGLLTAAETKAGTFRGDIIGKTPENLPIVKIDAIPGPFNIFTLQFPANNLEVGSELTLLPVPVPGTASQFYATAAPTAINTPGAALPAYSLLPPLFAGFDWPALEELTRTVQQISPSLSQSLTQAIPSPASPGRLPLAAMIFIAAVQSGDLSAWFGTKTVDTLRRAGHGDMLERLGRDVSSLQRSSAEPVSQDWRALTLPLMWQEEIHQMHLYWRRDKSGEQDNDKQAKTRFIFDLDLSRMGALQIDGLHRGKKLDLIVRTRKPLSQTMQKAMRRQYSSALEVAGIKGELHFQGKKENWVEIETRQPGGDFKA